MKFVRSERRPFAHVPIGSTVRLETPRGGHVLARVTHMCGEKLEGTVISSSPEEALPRGTVIRFSQSQVWV
jgi:hypothetical protein